MVTPEEGGSAFVQHYDGSSWAAVPGVESALHLVDVRRVAALAADDVWVVGDYEGPNGATLPGLVHWNGSGWQAY